MCRLLPLFHQITSNKNKTSASGKVCSASPCFRKYQDSIFGAGRNMARAAFVWKLQMERAHLAPDG